MLIKMLTKLLASLKLELLLIKKLKNILMISMDLLLVHLI